MKKKTYSTGMILGILSIPCGLLIAISGWVLGIIGIVLNVNHRDEQETRVGLILSIIGLVLSVCNSILGIVMTLG